MKIKCQFRLEFGLVSRRLFILQALSNTSDVLQKRYKQFEKNSIVKDDVTTIVLFNKPAVQIVNLAHNRSFVKIKTYAPKRQL